MSKTQLFLSQSNIKNVIKTVYSRYEGTYTISNITEQIPSLMQKFPQLQIFESYESLIYDEDAEIQNLNNLFVKSLDAIFVDKSITTLKKLSSPEDYHNYDMVRPDLDIYTTPDVYRYNNTIPLYQRQPARHYDFGLEGSGLHGRSIETLEKGYDNTDEILQHANKPYKTIDTNDVPYYGQDYEDDVTTNLL